MELANQPAKKYALAADQIVALIQSTEGCIATDRITVDGCKVGFMYREDTTGSQYPDSGWRFMAGDEDEAYMDNPGNHGVYQVNTICNYDRDIIPFLEAPPGTAYIRDEDDVLVLDTQWQGAED